MRPPGIIQIQVHHVWAFDFAAYRMRRLVRERLIQPCDVGMRFDAPAVARLLHPRIIPVPTIVGGREPFDAAGAAHRFPAYHLHPVFVAHARLLLDEHRVRLALEQCEIVAGPPPCGERDTLRLPAILVRLHERAVRVDERERQAFLPEHELGDHARTGMTVEHAPHRRIDHVPVAGDGSRVAPQKRAQRGHEIPPVDVRGGQRQLIHIRPDSHHAVMG